MIEQAKLLRVFTLTRLLKQQPGRTLPELAHYFECHPRTISRYLALLEEVGYFIDEDGQRRKFIFEAEPDKLPYFYRAAAPGPGCARPSEPAGGKRAP